MLDAIPSFCSGEYWAGIMQNTIGCTLGSLLAILAAYLIYLATTEGAKKEQDRQEADILFHFKLSVESVIAIVTKQTSNIEEYCTAIDKDDVYPPELTFQPMYGLIRISENSTLDRILIAYIRKFREKEDVKQFENLISQIDYFLSQFLVLPDEIKLTMEADHERKKEFARLYKEAYSALGDWILLNDPSLGTTEFGQEVAKVLTTMQEHRTDNYDIVFYHDYFFSPMNDIIIPRLPAMRFQPLIVQLANLTRDGKQLLLEIKAQNRVSKKNMEDLPPKLHPAITKLEEYATKLMTVS